jgi:hypothetical protein
MEDLTISNYKTYKKWSKGNKGLSPKQELFCNYYATDTNFFGNGLKSYAKAYNLDLNKKGDVNIAKSNAYRFLTKDYILRRIDVLLDQEGLNDQRVDKELLFLISQSANLNVKLGAIKEYNSLRKRIIEKKEVVFVEKWTPQMEKRRMDKLLSLSERQLLKISAEKDYSEETIDRYIRENRREEVINNKLGDTNTLIDETI